MTAVRVTFLGTGSTGDPNRRCGSTLVTLSDGTHVLVDTGGGNEILLALDAVQCDVTRIRAIVLTHQHLDHAAGLPFVLFQLAIAAVRLGADFGPIDICVPAPALHGLQVACETFFPGITNPWWLGDRVRWHGCTPQTYVWRLNCHGDGTSVVIGTPGGGGDADLEEEVYARIETMAVSHGAPPVPAQSVRIETRRHDGSRCRIVISGDTGPNLGMMQFAAHADLLIHEAIDAEALGANPITVFGIGHTTAAGAAQVATIARAKRLALHHLSVKTGQNPDVVRLEASAHFAGDVIVPHDGQSIDV